MCVGELLTAVREKLRIIVIVFSDASLSLIEIKQQAGGYRAGRRRAGDRATGRRSPKALASAAFAAATNEAELERAIEQARTGATGRALIEAKIDPIELRPHARAVVRG